MFFTHWYVFFGKKEKEIEVIQSCLTLCDPVDCSLLCSSIHGIFQARVLEWVAISFSYHFRANRWGNSGTVCDFILGGSKVTADDDCSHEIKRRLLLGRKVMTNLDSILKSRNIALSVLRKCIVSLSKRY